MTPYDLYLQEQAMQKQAVIGGLLRAGTNLATTPQFTQFLGSGAKWLGNKIGWQGLARAGGKVEEISGKLDGHINNWMNKGPALPGKLGDIGSWHPGIQKALKVMSFGGVNTNPGQRLTLQRGAMWAGGGLMLGDTVKGTVDMAKGMAAPRPAPQPYQQPIKQAAEQQAEADFTALVRYLEGR